MKDLKFTACRSLGLQVIDVKDLKFTVVTLSPRVRGESFASCVQGVGYLPF